MQPFVRSSPIRSERRASLGARVVFAAGLCLAGCEGSNGIGHVEAHLLPNECSPERSTVLDPYAYDAAYLATERFGSTLLIDIQKYRVDVEEGDGLVIRLDLGELIVRGDLILDRSRHQIVRRDPSRPLMIRTSTRSNEASVALSLFKTCPFFPTHVARDGVLAIDKLNIAEDPSNTGENERIGGVLTSTMARANARGAVGRLRADFDFAPPRRPLRLIK